MQAEEYAKALSEAYRRGLEDAYRSVIRVSKKPRECRDFAAFMADRVEADRFAEL